MQEKALVGSAEQVEAGSEEVVYPKGFKVVVIIVALILAVFLVALDQTIIATAIPRITDRFKSVLDVGWYGSVGTLSDLLSPFLVLT